MASELNAIEEARRLMEGAADSIQGKNTKDEMSDQEDADAVDASAEQERDGTEETSGDSENRQDSNTSDTRSMQESDYEDDDEEEMEESKSEVKPEYDELDNNPNDEGLIESDDEDDEDEDVIESDDEDDEDDDSETVSERIMRMVREMDDEDEDDEMSESDDEDEDDDKEMSESDDDYEDEDDEMSESDDEDYDDEEMSESDDEDEDDEMSESDDYDDYDDETDDMVEKRLKEMDDDEENKEKMDEHYNAIFSKSQKNLTEEFKAHTRTVFEAAVRERVHGLAHSLTEHYKTKYAVAKTKAYNRANKQVENLVDGIDRFLSATINEWVEDNQTAIDSGLRGELLESLQENIFRVFEEHHIEVPTGKFNVLDEMHKETEILKTELSEQIAKNVELRNKLNEQNCEREFDRLTSNLSSVGRAKIARLAEGIETSDPKKYSSKIKTLVETYSEDRKTSRSNKPTKDTTETIVNGKSRNLSEVKELIDDEYAGMDPLTKSLIEGANRVIRDF
jgi:hypothetical protein